MSQAAITGQRRNASIWSAVLGTATIMGSYALACVFPFAALAAVAALTVSKRSAVILMIAVWAANQAVGFGLMDYPHEAATYAWGVIILVASMAALAAAGACNRENWSLATRAGTGLIAAIATYQAIMFVAAWALDGFASSTPAIVAQVVFNDMLWFAALMGIHTLLMRAAPRLSRRATT